MLYRTDVVREARSWIDVRRAHQGRTRAGIDCVGLIIRVGKDLGILDYDTTNYQRHMPRQGCLHNFQEHMDQKAVADVVSGNVMLFRDKQFPCHSAIVGDRDGLTIIHVCALQRRVVEEQLDQGDWIMRRVACFAFRGLED